MGKYSKERLVLNKGLMFFFSEKRQTDVVFSIELKNRKRMMQLENNLAKITQNYPNTVRVLYDQCVCVTTNL